jgi:hypothetical protein
VDEYLAELVMSDKGVASANMALAAIADKQVLIKLENPCIDASIKITMQGIKRVCGKPVVQARGFTKGDVKGIISLAIGSHLDGGPKASLTMWREAWRELVCFLGVARFSDLSRVQRKDVSIKGNTVKIVFNTRKNDPTHRGHTIFLFENGTRYCPVRITKMYLSLLPLAPDVCMIPDLAASARFRKPASYAACRNQQKSLLWRLDVDPGPYGLHSARVGGAKYLQAAQMSVEDRNRVVGWAEGSTQPENYAAADMAKFLVAARSLELKTVLM